MACAPLLLEQFIYKKRNFVYAFVRHRLFVLCKQSLIRVQSAEGIKRVEISPKSNLKQLYDVVQNALKVDGFGLFMERNFATELQASGSQLVSTILKHGDMLYLKQMAGTSTRRTSTTAMENLTFRSAGQVSNEKSSNSTRPTNDVIEDAVDQQLLKSNGTINRERDAKLCHHNANGRCVHCSPLEPYNENYLKEHNIKHLSFHSYLRKQTSGMDHGKYFVFDDINCRIKPGCREHPPWPKGICSKCQPSAITLNRQTYRHVDNVMFENTKIVERFLNYWRTTGHQRMGYLYGTYEQHTDVPLGIRAKVAAIYEPPQESSRDSINICPDEGADEVDAVAKALGLKKIGWIFTDLITEDASAGTVKQIRGIETHFLTAQECISAGELQNRHPNPCKYATNGTFGSKFVTICVTGDQTKQVHMEGYAVSAQCMALVRDNCLIPTKDAPELGYVRESTDKQYVPDVFYKEKDQYGNEVQRLARPLPVEYLLVDVPASTPLQPQYTFTEYDKRQAFPIENRYIDGQLQDFNALSSYLSAWADDEFLEAISDFHLLVYLYKMDMLPLRQHMGPLLEAVRARNPNKAADFKAEEVWQLLESLVQASSTGSGGTTSYPSGAATSSGAAGSDAMDLDANTWTCNHCTFINRGELTSCEICSLPR
ncbi:nuclear protein localization protein 4 homolog isoform X1 [Drosophila grimshawi]|uniref:Nuclear protein localization protein 4 homolog n=1 Tax=Drosophila grimshawi TaxID=7222 RepID=B4JHL2_DROGR|nr:nuclear protein localization protein 4 homolog isoform X1 [Drosophila grimshawi]EDV92839.1 GH18610 [Drosophila grimshawi]